MTFDPVVLIVLAAAVVGAAVWYFRKRPQDQVKVEEQLKKVEDKIKEKI